MIPKSIYSANQVPHVVFVLGSRNPTTQVELLIELQPRGFKTFFMQYKCAQRLAHELLHYQMSFQDNLCDVIDVTELFDELGLNVSECGHTEA